MTVFPWARHDHEGYLAHFQDKQAKVGTSYAYMPRLALQVGLL
jgi:hypothetical protein